MSHTYAFDAKLSATLRIKAGSEDEARWLLGEYLDCASANFGADRNGDPLVGEVSLATDPSEAELVEVDGVPPSPNDDFIKWFYASDWPEASAFACMAAWNAAIHAAKASIGDKV